MLTMERDLGPLKCSKLNCYVEFNKMVQALIRHQQSSGHSVPGVSIQRGTRAEYNFYTTLSMMLQQIKNNNSADIQKKELQELYQWFVINKPFTKPKSKPLAHKPSLKLTSMPSIPSVPRSPLPSPIPSPVDRPQTAPAAFHHQVKNLRHSGRSNSRPTTSFASQYMNNSLGSKINLIGMSLDQLKSTGTLKSLPELPVSSEQERPSTGSLKANIVSVQTLPSPMPHERRKGSPHNTNQGTQNRLFLDPTRPTSPSKPKAMVSVQSFPSPTFLANHIPEGRSGLHPHLMPRVYLSDVFSLAPQVAARMVLEREEETEESEFELLRKLLKSTAVPQTVKKHDLSSNKNPPSTAPSISSGTHRHLQQPSPSPPPLSNQSQIKVNYRDKQAKDQTRKNTYREQLQSPTTQEPGSEKIRPNQVHKTDLSDIKEESEQCEIPAHQKIDVGSSADVVASETQLSESHLDPTGGTLHFNSVNSLCSTTGPPGSTSGKLPVTSVTVEQPDGGKAVIPEESKDKQSASCSVVTISFETGQQPHVLPKLGRTPKAPNRTPNSAAGFRRRRYYRPHTLKVQEVSKTPIN